MREIKFRGKRLDNGEWVYGCLTRYSEKASYITVDLIEDEVYQVDTSTVSQYTGMRDRYLTKIYEKDILLTDLSRPYLVVEFRNGAFMYQCHDSGQDYYDFMTPVDAEDTQDLYVEVVGNICDNSEILE